ncbi:MAG: helix-turn-helix domain-containing protein [Clostridia bacterium]
MQFLTIGQMAEANKISTQTLRLYDKMGLFCPVNRDDENGYRYYDIRQNARLDMIQYLKSIGLSLKEIKKQLASENIDNITTLLINHRITIDEQIAELKLRRRAVDRTIKSFELYKDSPPDGLIILEHLPRRTMYLINTNTNFYSFGIEVYEDMLRKLKNSLDENGISPLFFCNAGTILRKDKAINRQFDSTEVFVFIDDKTLTNQLTAISAGNYMCVYCDNFSKEQEYANKMFDYIDNNGYQITGDYICEVIADLPVVESHERGMFLRLQVPVSFKK